MIRDRSIWRAGAAALLIGWSFGALAQDPDPGIALEDIVAIADSGDVDAQYRLGTAYQIGEGVPQDYGKAATWFTHAANKGHLPSITTLAGLTAEGLGRPKNLELAFQMYEKAASHNYAPAQHILGSMIENGLGTALPRADARSWYEKAATSGLTEAQASLGVLYHRGDIIDQDYDKALMWYEKAAEQGNVRAQNNLGQMFTKGLGVEQDYELAAKYFAVAAEAGFPQAMTNLGVLYANGFGVPQSDEMSEKLYRQATEANRASRTSAGLPDEAAIKAYVQGNDFNLKALKRTANQGDPTSQYVLGNLYMNGWKVPQDYVLAYKWLNLSANSPDSAAAGLRDSLRERMTNGQLNSAQKLSRDWLARRGG